MGGICGGVDKGMVRAYCLSFLSRFSASLLMNSSVDKYDARSMLRKQAEKEEEEEGRRRRKRRRRRKEITTVSDEEKEETSYYRADSNK